MKHLYLLPFFIFFPFSPLGSKNNFTQKHYANDLFTPFDEGFEIRLSSMLKFQKNVPP